MAEASVRKDEAKELSRIRIEEQRQLSALRIAERRRISEAMVKDCDDARIFLATVLGDEDQKTSDRITAAKEILDRGLGKTAQAVEVSGPDGDPLEVKSSLAESLIAALTAKARSGDA